MRSMVRSMDWTLENNMVDGLFFCATLTGRWGGRPHLYKQERKRPTPVRMRLSRNQALLERVIRGGAGVGDENAQSCGVVRPLRRTYVVVVRWNDEMLCGGYKWVSRFEAQCVRTRWTSEHWMEQMSRLHGTVCYRDSVAPLLQSSAGWMPARIGRLSAGVGRRHTVTIRKASLMAGSMRQVWALRHHTGARYSTVECTRVRVAIPAPQPEPPSRQVRFLRSGSGVGNT